MTMPAPKRTIYRQVFYVPTSENPPDGEFYYQITPRSPVHGPFKTREDAVGDACFQIDQDLKLYPEEKQP